MVILDFFGVLMLVALALSLFNVLRRSWNDLLWRMGHAYARRHPRY